MLKLPYKSLVILGGIVWFAIGLMLFSIGTNLFITGVKVVEEGVITSSAYSWMQGLANFTGKAEVAAAILFACSTCIGYFKGRYVLIRSAKRTIDRLKSLSMPAPIYQLYSPPYYLLLAVMVGFGLSIKYLGITGEVRAIIDVAIGTALLSGSLEYFRCAFCCTAPQRSL